jgi:non-heme chloroperoxidase
MIEGPRIRVFMVDDHPLMREGIAAILRSQPDTELVADAATGCEAIKGFGQHRPDVTLMDVRLPDMSGIDAVIAIRSEFPEARILGPDVKQKGSPMSTSMTVSPKTSKTQSASPAPITEHEAQQVERANATRLQPVVFVHGLWLLPSSWDRWAVVFEQVGYTAITPGWPDDPETVDEAKKKPEVFAHKTVGQVADHFDQIVRGLNKRPAIIGHSFGGLLAQILAGRGLASATVAIDPAPFRGVLPLPFSALKSAFPVLGNPANRNRAIPLTFDQFRFGFANAVSEEEAKHLYDTFAVPGSGAPLFQAAAANLNPWTEVRVDTENPERGPLLIISGEKDHTVPWAIANASFKRQRRNASVTEIVEIPNRGHALTIDSGWRDVADTALAFIKRFA